MTDKTAKLAVSNQKGGVGKTATAINLAGAFNHRGHRVLFVDLDPQGNATEGLGLADAYEAEPPSLFDALTNHDARDVAPELVREHPEADVLPSNIDMTSIEPELTMAMRGRERLGLVLEEIEAAEGYDIVLVDSPPFLGNLTDNALLATGNVLIPALAETTSKRALEILYDQIEVLTAEYDHPIRDLGVVANRVDVRKNEATEMVEWFREAFTDVPVWEVRERAAIQQTFAAGVSLFEYDPESDMLPVYLEIAADVEKQLGTRPEVA